MPKCCVECSAAIYSIATAGLDVYAQAHEWRNRLAGAGYAPMFWNHLIYMAATRLFVPKCCEAECSAIL